MNDYMTLLHKHKINGGFLAPDRIPMEERNKNEMILELQNEVHIKDKEIERLKEELEYTIPIVEHNKTITKHLKEIERLKSRLEEYQEYVKINHKEIERLNNIINEFDKWLDVNLFNLEKENANNTYDKGLKQGMLTNGRLIKNKLQELKGVDKE